MKIERAKEVHDGVLEAEVDGEKMFIPQDPANRHYRELMAQKVRVAPADPDPAPSEPPLTAEALLEELKGLGVIGANVTAESVMQRRRERRR
jgi:hypothetical protein